MTTGERSPLFMKQQSSTASESPDHHNLIVQGNASVAQTVINLAKTCMGTGCLALPFAAQQSGVGFFIVGTLAIALWNVYAVQRLCHSWELVKRKMIEYFDDDDDDDEVDNEREGNVANGSGSYDATSTEEYRQYKPPHSQQLLSLPPEGTSTLGQVTWYAFGYEGLRTMDILMIILLFGIIVAYQDAVLSFLSDTFLSEWRILNAFCSASLMATLSVVHDVGALTNGSAFGLCVLFISMSILTIYGIVSTNTNNKNTTNSMLPLLPQHGLTGISQWFGCVVFGFGTVPLTYNFQSSMAHPHLMVSASVYALVGFVATCYIILGVGLLYLYPHLEGDVLHVLPTDFWLAQVTRWAMIVVILLTAPLLVVPCGQLIEGKIRPRTSNNSHDNISNAWTTRCLVRFGVCYTCAIISTLVPGFVNVLSLVGCASVALVSFCVPPLLHIAVLKKSNEEQVLQRNVDLIMLALGLLATSISTVYTLCKITSFCYSKV